MKAKKEIGRKQDTISFIARRLILDEFAEDVLYLFADKKRSSKFWAKSFVQLFLCFNCSCVDQERGKMLPFDHDRDNNLNKWR